MFTVKTVLGNDSQTIKGIYGPEDRWQVEIGKTVDLIAPYLEDGDTPWFAIYHSGKITQRINAAYVESVVYA